MMSARNFPGTVTAVNALVASIIALKNGSSVDLTSIPYVTDIIVAPGMLRGVVGRTSVDSVEREDVIY